MNMTPKYVRGGIGDMLLSLEDAIKEQNINIFSHYAQAPEFFKPFNVTVQRFDYFENQESLHACFISGEELPRKQYPVFKLPDAPVKTPSRKVLGIHIEGSKFSNDAWSKRGQPTKDMNVDFLSKVMTRLNARRYRNTFIYIFCSPDRTQEVGALFAEQLVNDFYVISFPKIWDSLACVRHCDAVLASDSCVKTMAGILGIPSVVLVGDYADPFRDRTFLTPYVDDGHMQVIKYKNINDVSIDEVFSKIAI